MADRTAWSKLEYGLILLLLLAFALRVAGLADHNIWWDEGVSAWAARLPVGRILDWTAHDTHPPLYYLMLHGWWSLVGDGEFVLRFPSVVAGIVGIVAIFGLSRAMMGRRAGLLAALLLTLSAFSVSWSQEIRMYTLAATLATGALWAAFRLWQRASWGAWLAYVVACAGALWTLYLTVTVPLLANLGFVVVWLKGNRPRGLLARWLAAQAAVAALVVPWLVYALPKIPTWSVAEPLSPLFVVRLYANMLAVGISANLERYTLLMVLALTVLMGAIVMLWRAGRSVEQRAGTVMLVAGLILPAALVYALALPVHLFYTPSLQPRYLLPLAACFYALLGLGLAATARRWRWIAAVGTAAVVVVALTGLAAFYPGRVRRDDLISLAATLRAFVQPTDTVVLYDDHDWPVFAAHYAGPWHGVPNGATFDAMGAAAWLAPLWDSSTGIWLVTTPHAQQMDPQGTIPAWLEDSTASSLQWNFGDNAVTFFARTADRAAKLYDLGPQAEVPAGPPIELGGAALAGAWLPLPRYVTGDVVRLVLLWVQPPSGPIAVELNGPAAGQITASPPHPATSGLTRQQVDLMLYPDLPEGTYHVEIRDASGQAVEIGRFALLSRAAPGKVTVADIATPLEVRFGKAIRLLGYSLRRTKVEPGGTVDLTLYWQTDAAIDVRYKVFTHLLGEQYNPSTGNFLWAQQDNEPQGGTMPTTAWPRETVIADSYSIPVSPGAPPGRYALEVGLYGLVDGTRLPVLDAVGRAEGDSAIVAQVEVTSEAQ